MSNFNVVRAENGQIRFTVNNVKDFDIGGVAKVTGSATFSVGNTGQASNETVLEMGATKDTPTVLQIDDDLNNMEFYGSNLEAKFSNHTDKQYNVQWSATDSTLNSTKDSGSLLINTHEKSENNTFNLGTAKTKQTLGDVTADNFVVDNGRNNTFYGAEKGADYFETSETSIGANIYGGNGSNTFAVGGKNGFIVGGSGIDTFITNGNSEKNILAGMDGDDVFTDFGNSNLILGGKGTDTVNINGKNGLANLGFGEDYNANIGEGAQDNAVFAGEELKASDLTTYNYQEYLTAYLQDNGITMSEFIARAGLSENASREDIIAALKGEL